MHVLSCSRAYSNTNNAAEGLKELLDSKLNSCIMVVASYGNNTFKFEKFYKMDPKIQKIIDDNLQGAEWNLKNSTPTIPQIRLTAIKMENEEFEALKNKITACGLVINEAIIQSRL